MKVELYVPLSPSVRLEAPEGVVTFIESFGAEAVTVIVVLPEVISVLVSAAQTTSKEYPAE